MTGDQRDLVASIEALAKQRDLARAEVAALQAQRDAWRAVGMALQEALLGYLPRCGGCSDDGKRCLITVKSGPYWSCDKCARDAALAPESLRDLPYAPAWRALCALLKASGG